MKKARGPAAHQPHRLVVLFPRSERLDETLSRKMGERLLRAVTRLDHPHPATPAAGKSAIQKVEQRALARVDGTDEVSPRVEGLTQPRAECRRGGAHFRLHLHPDVNPRAPAVKPSLKPARREGGGAAVRFTPPCSS